MLSTPRRLFLCLVLFVLVGHHPTACLAFSPTPIPAPLATSAISIAVLSITLLSPFLDDAEGAAARKNSTQIDNDVRDTKEAWQPFNFWSWLVKVPGLAFTRPEG